MHPQRLAVAIAAGVGGVCTFLPWVTVPLFGSVNGTEIDGRGWITFGLCTAAFLCALSVDSAAPLTGGGRTWSRLFGLATAGVGVWTIVEINETPLGRAMSNIGIGLYLLIAAGGAIVLLPGFIKQLPKEPPARS